MNDILATYTFLPWLRQGIANNIQSTDLDSSVKLRAGIDVHLQLEGEKLDGGKLTEDIQKTISLYGPGDIVGIDSKAIVKNEPRNWITNFEPNYLPYIEFYDEDFPWRYTPAASNTVTDRLRPWITLVVLKEDEFTEGRNIKDKPLAYIEVEDTDSVFPPTEQLWAWAHVHINEGLMNEIEAAPEDKDKVIDNFKEVLSKNPDLAYSRVVCPRKLEPSAAYHAFLIPTFESGRLAGIGLDMEQAPHATFSAWGNYTGKMAPLQFPVYYRWYFKTGTVGDFEYLVRLLEPRPVDKRVGNRDMDVQNPGSNIDGITDADLGGVLKLGGALKIPFDTLEEEDKEEVIKYDTWFEPYPHPFQQDLAQFINLSDDYAEKPADQAHSETDLPAEIQNDPDPLITAPLYGRWHALTQRLLKNRDGSDGSNNQNWVHDLNLDPRYRVAAGFGTGVIQENQEKYMKAAWDQVGDILEANRKMRQAQLAKEASYIWHHKHLEPITGSRKERALKITAPVQNRVIAEDFTVAYQVKQSKIPQALTSMPMRRITRSGSRLMKSLTFNETASIDNLLLRVNNDQVIVAPPKSVPNDLPTVNDLAEDMLPESVQPVVIDWLRDYPFMKYLPLILAVIVILILLFTPLSGLGMTIVLAILAGLAYLYRSIQNWTKQIGAADAAREENHRPEAVEELPKSPDFRISMPEDGFTPAAGSNDSPEAVRYKSALGESFGLIETSRREGVVVKKPLLDIPFMVDVTFRAIDPEVTIPRLIFGNIFIPDRIKLLLIEEFIEAMAYPEFDTPMYKPLVDISTELFLPNINYVSPNSISLLETNQKFIEAYMVGLNHEFARELLWREYPTDQRGSYFRQFWDVSSFYDDEDLDLKELTEKLRDIPPLHRWSKFSDLGDHDNREIAGENEEELVLVIRGELLKKYPNAVIYAHRARWQLDDDGEIDKKQERDLVELEPAEIENPPRTKIKTPLYEAKVDPEIYFFGFDLTATEAKGETGEDEDDPGWFFVIKERPGEPVFGLDIDQDGEEKPSVWNDLSWADVLSGGTDGDFIQITNSTATITLEEPTLPAEQEKQEQYTDDISISWDKEMNAADVAYILYQAPVLVAVHAAEMLPE